MTFRSEHWYSERDLKLAGIRIDNALELLVAKGEIKAVSNGFSDDYEGRGLLLAIDAGKLTVGEPIVSSAKRAAARPTTAVHRPAPTKPVAPQRSIVARTAIASVTTVQSSLQERYDTMSTAWRDVVDGHMESCGGDRARAVIRANREMPGLAQRVDALCNQLRGEKAAEIKTRPKLKGTARERLTAWLASGKRGACRLA